LSRKESAASQTGVPAGTEAAELHPRHELGNTSPGIGCNLCQTAPTYNKQAQKTEQCVRGLAQQRNQCAPDRINPLLSVPGCSAHTELREPFPAKFWRERQLISAAEGTYSGVPFCTIECALNLR